MNFKAQAEDALRKYDELVEKRNAFAGKEVTEEVRSEVANLDADIDSALEEVRNAQAQADRASEAEVLRSKVSSIYVPSTKADVRKGNDLNAELRSAILGGGALELAIPNANKFSDFRALSTSNGNFTNDRFVSAVMTAFSEQTSVFQAGATVMQTSTGEPINAPVVASIGAAKTAENVALPEAATSSNKTLSAYKYGAIVLVPRELVEDVTADLASLVAGMAGDNVSDEVNEAMLIGDGSGDPQGALVGSSLGHTAAGAGALVEADIYGLFYSLKTSAQNKGAWIMDPTTAAAVRSLEGLWSVNPALDNAQLLLGRPVYTDANMPNIGTGLKSVLFGDFSKYLVRQVKTLRVERSDDYKFGNDQVAIKVVWRGDGVVAYSNALKHIIHP
jgi:HK97 family phage major capsid protein